jgi:hypothetical protein
LAQRQAWTVLTGDDEIDVITKDLTIELRGRIESGGGVGIVCDGSGTSDEPDKEWLSVVEA